jgi:HAD superfamily hydrolase (TIGR01549 family)
MEYKTIIFDIDGTLIDTYEMSLKSLQRALYDVTKRKYSEAEISFHFGIPTYDALYQLGFDQSEIDKITKKIDEYYAEDFHFKFYRDIESVIKKLYDNGIYLGLVTSQYHSEYDPKFSDLPITRYFKTVICADDTTKHKPEPEPIEKFIQVSGADKKSTIYIGDTEYDCECAHGAEIKFALACWGAINKNIKADHFLKNPIDIFKLINKR